jgi:hypothetical protein
VLETRCGSKASCLTKLFNKKPCIGSIEEIDISRSTIEYGEGKIRVEERRNTRRFLVWVTS